jgi:NADH-ubiquinone oxidoreductase chain 5
MYILILILPLLSSIFSGLLGRKLGTNGSQIITTTLLFLTTLSTIFAFYEIGLGNSPVILNLNT